MEPGEKRKQKEKKAEREGKKVGKIGKERNWMIKNTRRYCNLLGNIRKLIDGDRQG